MKKYLYSLSFLFVVVSNVHAAATTTAKITKINVTPTSATAGTMFKFSAELDAPLPTGSKVKIDFGKGFILTSMTGKNTSYSLSRAIYTTGSQTYKIGIYNPINNKLLSKIVSGTYTVTNVAPENHAPTLSLVKAETTATTNATYSVTLNAKDIDANLSSITMNWGDNSEPETLTVTDGKDLTFSHIYTSASSFGWNTFASDKGTPVLNSKSISKIVTVSNPEPVEVKGDIETFVSGSRTFSYTKIANDGSELPKTAKLGTGAKDWACTKDNNTGLIWEIKTDDGGLRDWNNTYTNYNPSISLTTYESKTNAYGLVLAVNSQKLCGSNNWRIPEKNELESLIYCSIGNHEILGTDETGFVCSSNRTTVKTTQPTINTTYFPNTKAADSWFWSATPYSDGVWGSTFGLGFSGWGDRFNKGFLRLVYTSTSTSNSQKSEKLSSAATAAQVNNNCSGNINSYLAVTKLANPNSVELQNALECIKAWMLN